MRCVAGIPTSAFCNWISSSVPICCGAATYSCSAWMSPGVSTRPRRNEERRRVRQTFSAILNSHADSASGTIPRFRPRNAFRNVCWTASSASSRLPSLLKQ